MKILSNNVVWRVEGNTDVQTYLMTNTETNKTIIASFDVLERMTDEIIED